MDISKRQRLEPERREDAQRTNADPQRDPPVAGRREPATILAIASVSWWAGTMTEVAWGSANVSVCRTGPREVGILRDAHHTIFRPTMQLSEAVRSCQGT